MKDLGKERDYFFKNGLGAIVRLAKKYEQDLSAKYSQVHAERKRAEEIFTALVLLKKSWSEVKKDYQNLEEHILTPEIHQASARLRRQRQYLKGRSEGSAQQLYLEINRLLPVISSLQSQEMTRRQRALFALARARKSDI